MTDQLSAEIEARFSAGPLNAGAIVRVRDLIVCVGDPTIDVPIEEVYAHPPIGWGRHPGDAERFAEIVDMIDLGGGVVIEDLGRDAAELVMNACTPRGHYFVPVRQFGQRYSFIKEVALDELEHQLQVKPGASISRLGRPVEGAWEGRGDPALLDLRQAGRVELDEVFPDRVGKLGGDLTESRT